ncbi:unnamed protein product, partial [Oppiella nova]
MTESNGEMIVNNNLLVINDRNYTNSKSAGDEGDGEDRDGERFECDCRLGPNESACYTQFDGKVMSDHRIDYQSCDYWDDECYNLMNERIIAIMSVLINNSPEVENPTARRRKRQKTSVKFMWRGRPVCKQLFLWVHAMKKPKWTYLKKRYLAYGVEPRQHQNKTKPVNSKAINGEERKAIVQFIREYGRQNARNPNAGADRWDECDCRLGPNESACYTQFDGKVMSDHRIDYQSCDYWDDECYNLLNERIVAIMSVLINNSPEVENPTARRRKRQKTSVKFMWRGRPVCKRLFLWVHAMKKPKWTYLKKRYLAYGVEPRQHQNKTKPVNSKAINGEERKAIVQFIREYGRQNARNPNAGADRW